MDGRPTTFEPVLKSVVVGSWLGISTYIERIMQRSSATVPTLGHSSLKSMPLCPYFLNLKGDFIKLPTRKKLTGVEPGVGWPSYLSTIGLGSNESMCDTPPFIKR